MDRMFGKKKKAVPAPALSETSSNLGGRVDEMDKKIAGLEQELRVYKDKIKKARSPAAKQAVQKRAMEILKRKKNVRRPARHGGGTTIQHRPGEFRDRECQGKRSNDCGNEGGQPGNQEYHEKTTQHRRR
mmetsp:Transcript_1144/g.2382  ORF Transcript_1144/g.2382 Transcript_1144/m.2382 type:complete len:130 (-) Transcript_1144:3542-3931(-)